MGSGRPISASTSGACPAHIQSAFSDARTYCRRCSTGSPAARRARPRSLGRFRPPLLESLDYTLEYQRLAVRRAAPDTRSRIAPASARMRRRSTSWATTRRSTSAARHSAACACSAAEPPQPHGRAVGRRHQRQALAPVARHRPAHPAHLPRSQPAGDDRGQSLRRVRRLLSLAASVALPQGGADADKCLLEQYYQQGIEEGGRVRERLRVGVERALEGLGIGFLAHPDNAEGLRQAFGARLDPAGFYRQLLRLRLPAAVPDGGRRAQAAAHLAGRGGGPAGDLHPLVFGRPAARLRRDQPLR